MGCRKAVVGWYQIPENLGIIGTEGRIHKRLMKRYKEVAFAFVTEVADVSFVDLLYQHSSVTYCCCQLPTI